MSIPDQRESLVPNNLARHSRKLFSLGLMGQQPDNFELRRENIVDAKSLSLLTASLYLNGRLSTAPYQNALGRWDMSGTSEGQFMSMGVNSALGYGSHDSIQYMINRALALGYATFPAAPVNVLIPLKGKADLDALPDSFNTDFKSLKQLTVSKTTDQISGPVLPIWYDAPLQIASYVLNGGKTAQYVNLCFIDITDIPVEPLIPITEEDALPVPDDIRDISIEIDCPSVEHTVKGLYVVAQAPNSLALQPGSSAVRSSDNVFSYMDPNDFKYWKFSIALRLYGCHMPLQDNQSDTVSFRVNPTFMVYMPFMEDVVYRKITGRWGSDSVYPKRYPYEMLRGEIEDYERTDRTSGTKRSIVIDSYADQVFKYFQDPSSIDSITLENLGSTFGLDNCFIQL